MNDAMRASKPVFVIPEGDVGVVDEELQRCCFCGSGLWYRKVTHDKYSAIEAGGGMGGRVRLMKDIIEYQNICAVCGHHEGSDIISFHEAEMKDSNIKWKDGMKG